MALHTTLPIYKVAYEFFDLATDLVKNMPRDFKQSLGSKIRDEAVAITVLIFRANSASEKAPHLQSLVERLEVINLILRLSRDKRLISTTQYAKAIEKTGSIGKQANGWKNSATRPLHGGHGRHD